MDRVNPQEPSFSCPLPHPTGDAVLLGHGSGGRLSEALIRDVFLAELDNPVLAQLDDQAILDLPGAASGRLAFSTDSFVVKPLFFPGGDIGSLAVHGTVNDIAVGGAEPLWLSAGFIVEEGLPLDTLRTIVQSMQRAAREAGVTVVTGDTKVVERGSGDGVFINTSGIGLVRPGVNVSAQSAAPGDAVLVSGTLGDHGIAIMAQREGLEFETTIESDSASLNGLIAALLAAAPGVHCMRDPTRGGLSSALNEIAASSGVGIALDDRSIPIQEQVRGACELLGLDPLYVANEGKLIAIVPGDEADAALAALRAHPLGGDAQRIGTVVDERPGIVTLRTTIGTTRIVDMLSGDQLPRIC